MITDWNSFSSPRNLSPPSLPSLSLSLCDIYLLSLPLSDNSLNYTFLHIWYLHDNYILYIFLLTFTSQMLMSTVTPFQGPHCRCFQHLTIFNKNVKKNYCVELRAVYCNTVNWPPLFSYPAYKLFLSSWQIHWWMAGPEQGKWLGIWQQFNR